MHGAAGYGGWFTATMHNAFCTRVGSRSDHVHTINGPQWSSLVAVPRTPLRGEGGSHHGHCGAHLTQMTLMPRSRAQRRMGMHGLIVYTVPTSPLSALVLLKRLHVCAQRTYRLKPSYIHDNMETLLSPRHHDIDYTVMSGQEKFTPSPVAAIRHLIQPHSKFTGRVMPTKKRHLHKSGVGFKITSVHITGRQKG